MGIVHNLSYSHVMLMFRLWQIPQLWSRTVFSNCTVRWNQNYFFMEMVRKFPCVAAVLCCYLMVVYPLYLKSLVFYSVNSLPLCRIRIIPVVAPSNSLNVHQLLLMDSINLSIASIELWILLYCLDLDIALNGCRSPLQIIHILPWS